MQLAKIHLLRKPDKYPGPRKLLKYKWLTTNQARMTKQGCWFERPNFIMANRKSEKRTANNRRGWMVIVGAGLNSWNKTYSLDRWSLVKDWFPLVQEDGRWSRTGICWCRKVVAASGLVVAGVCWCRKAVAGSGLVVAGAELVAAGICWCMKVIAGAGLVAASAGKWSPVQDW